MPHPAVRLLAETNKSVCNVTLSLKIFEPPATAPRGNRCELVGDEVQTHGFFNHGRGDGSSYRATIARTDALLVSLGWLAEPARR